MIEELSSLARPLVGVLLMSRAPAPLMLSRTLFPLMLMSPAQLLGKES